MTLSYIPSDTNDEGILKAPASGVLPNGKPVIVNADGTVSVVAETSVSDSVGTPGVFTNSNLDSSPSENPQVGSAYDVNADRIVVCYRLTSGGKYGYAVVGQVDSSDNSISFGTPTVFNSAETPFPAPVYDAASQKIVIGFSDHGGGQNPYAIVATVNPSNNSISFGTKVQIDTGSWDYGSGAYDSANQKVVFTWTTGLSVKSAVGTVSNTSISFGTINTFFTTSNSYVVYASVTYESSSGKIVSVFTDVGNGSEGQAVVGTVSGTTISYGTPAIYNSSAGYNSVASVGSSKVIIGYLNSNNNINNAEAIVGTISGTSISYGSATNITGTGSCQSLSLAFGSDVGNAVIAYRDNSDSGHGKLNVLSISGTNITAGSDITFENSAIHTTLGTTTTFDSTNNRMVISYPNDGDSGKGKSVVFRVGGSIPNLTAENYIGMSSGVVDVNSVAQAAGSSTVFEAANSAYISATFDSNSNKVVIAFRDDGDSGKGKAIVGTVSGTSISFGSAAVFYSGFSNYIVASFDSSNNKVVIAYRDDNNSDYGTAIVGTVSGTNISFGSATVFESARSDHITSTFNSTSGKIVIAYTDVGNSSILTAIVGTVSGTSISFGTAVAVTGNPQGYYNSITSESASSKIVIGYTNGSNSNYGTAVVGTVSSTSISFGTPVVFESATATFSSATFDSTSGKVVIAYTDGGNSSYGTAIVGTVSNTSISFGDATVFESGSSSEFSASFDPLSNSVVVAYRDNGNSNYITFAIGSVSGSSVSFSSPVVFDTAGSEYISSVAYGNEAKVVIAYKDAGNSNYGTAGVIQPAYTYITRGEVPSGSQAITNIIGSVSSIQTGLTAGQSYFVQTDGTIGLTAADPSVFAGTAISATKLIVKT